MNWGLDEMVNIVATDNQLRELKSHGSNDFSIEYYLDDTEAYGINKVNQHWHSEVEFAIVQKGKATFQIGNDLIPIEQGNGIFINSKIIHGFESNERAIIPNIVLSPEIVSGMNQIVYQKFVEPIISSKNAYLILSQDIEWQRKMLSQLQLVFNLMESDSETRELDVQQSITSIWRSLYVNRSNLIQLARTTNISTQVRLRSMLKYIWDNYSRKLSLAEIASAANISKNEALRCFREEMSDSPIDYLIRFRLDKASKLLQSTDYSITDISASVGFESLSYFNRVFKKTYGNTSTAFRKKHKLSDT
ncbi:AraC family transcriptional regulator [Paenibacillus sp. ACRRY]|uniref:AraC family transcriptional regulator n=1 Tax=Paenibacillus sp. ACRRY TaxID=2918208 RepID=UPI001EF6A3D1|nr:AraC family transcriptional regulator [Paenibacillus sp. ACRRY]MCG7384501.1 AraC family transcriptional regulator [Paenibacillus sp. ACRRY]